MKNKIHLFFCFLFSAVLLAGCSLIPDAGETPSSSPQSEEAVTEMEVGKTYTADWNADGKEDSIALTQKPSSGHYEEICVLEVSLNGGDKLTTSPDSLEIPLPVSAYLYTSAQQVTGVLISVDLASEDYATYCFTGAGTNGILEPVSHIYGFVTGIQDEKAYIGGHVDVLGTWMASTWYALDPVSLSLSHDKATPWLLYCKADQAIEVSKALKVQLEKDGSYQEATLQPGTKLILIQTDAETYVDFELDDGAKGKLSFTRSSYGTTLIEGMDDYKWFRELRYSG